MSNKSVDKEALKVTPYVKECLEICWLMTIQDPPLVFGPVQKRGDAFDPEAYRAYTSSGPVVDFIVWPAIYLYNGGPILCKGIVQGAGDKPRAGLEREGSKKNDVISHDDSKHHLDAHSNRRSGLEIGNTTRKHGTEYNTAKTTYSGHSHKTHRRRDSYDGSETGLEHPEKSYGRYSLKEDGSKYGTENYPKGSTDHRPSSSYQQTTMNTRTMIGHLDNATKYRSTMSEYHQPKQAW